MVDERFGHGCIPLLNCMAPHPPMYVLIHMFLIDCRNFEGYFTEGFF